MVDAQTMEIVQSFLIRDETRVRVDGSAVFIDLDVLEYSTEYFVTLAPDAVISPQGAAFGGFDDAGVWSFTTVAPDPVTLLDTFPSDDAKDVSPDVVIVLTFSEQVSAGSGSIYVFDSDGMLATSVDVTDAAVTVSSNTMTVVLPQPLANASDYYVNVDTGAVVSWTGGLFVGLSNDEDFSFTTAAAPPPPLTLLGTSPDDNASGVSVDTLCVWISAPRSGEAVATSRCIGRARRWRLKSSPSPLPASRWASPASPSH